METAFGFTRSTSFSSRARSRGRPHSTVCSVTSAPARVMISRMRVPKTPATTTSTRSPGSITEIAEASSAVRPEPGIAMTSPRLVWKMSRRARVTGSRILASKFRSYWMVAGWLIACTTGNGSSVGPGIIRMGWDWIVPQRMLASIETPLREAERRLRPGLGQAALLPPDQIEVSQVHEEARALTEDEDRIQAVHRVDQQGETAADREEPEGDRDHALLLPLRRDPLHQEAHREERLSQEAERQPEVLGRHHRFVSSVSRRARPGSATHIIGGVGGSQGVSPG